VSTFGATVEITIRSRGPAIDYGVCHSQYEPGSPDASSERAPGLGPRPGRR
jgi:hypothetical protein